MKSLRTRFLALLTIMGLVSACVTSYEVPEEWRPEDQITFVVLGAYEAPPTPGIPGIDVFLVGDKWATRVDVTDQEGNWIISRKWLDDAEKILFCWPDGPFDCTVIRIPESRPFPAAVQVNLPEPIRNQRSAIWRKQREK